MRQHVAVIAAIAIYATGASKYSSNHTDDNANAEWRTGVVLLLLLWLLLCLVFTILARKAPGSFCKSLLYAIAISLVLIGVRVIFQCIATFNKNHGAFDPVTGSIALRVVFQFLPGAFTLLALAVGGVMSIESVAMARTMRGSDVEMVTRDGERRNNVK